MKRLNIKNKLSILAEYETLKYNNMDDIIYDKLLNLLHKACNYSKYYNNIFNDNNISIDCINNIEDIKLCPVLNKYCLNALNTEDMITGMRNGIKRMTAGTSGKPVTVFVSSEALSWQLSTRYHFYNWYGIKIGDREARFWGRPVEGHLYKINDYLLNRKRFTFTNNNKDLIFKEYNYLFSYKPDYLYGYSSLILNAAEFIYNNKLKPLKLKAIICTAESITKFQKQYIEKIFSCPVVEEYGCSETDIIAFECPNRNLHIASFRTIFELTENNEVIITDLDNLLMPLIRYELGDSVIISNDKCSCGRNLPVISKLLGRTINQLVKLEDGGSFHAVVFAYMLEDLVKKGFMLKQFKIIQCGRTITFVLDIDDDRDKFNRELRYIFNKLFGDKLNINVEFKPIEIVLGEKYSYFEHRSS